MTKRVYSYALFNHPRSQYEHPNAGAWRGFRFYPSFLPTLVRAHHAVFSGFELRIHHDGCIDNCYYGRTLIELERRGLVRLVYCGEARTLCGSMLWRMLPIWDPDAEYVWCRDVDSLPLPRDRWAAEAFADPFSPNVVSSISDSPAHGEGLCGGMIGFQARTFRALTQLRSLDELIARGVGIDLNAMGSDQDLLNRHLPGLQRWTRRFAFDPKTGRAVIPEHDMQIDVPPFFDQLAPHLGIGYARAPVLDALRGRGRTADIEEAECVTGDPPLIEDAAKE